MRRVPVVSAAGVLCALVGLVPASADIVTYTFDGNLTFVDDPDNVLLGATTFSGSITFDTLTPDNDPNLASGQYNAGQIIVAIGPVTLDLPNHTIFVLNDVNGEDSFVVEAAGTSVVAATVNSSINFLLTDSTGTAFGSDALPAAPPDLASFDLNAFDTTMQFAGAEGSLAFVQGVVTSLVPEPATAMLGITLLAVLGARRRW